MICVESVAHLLTEKPHFVLLYLYEQRFLSYLLFKLLHSERLAVITLKTYPFPKGLNFAYCALRPAVYMIQMYIVAENRKCTEDLRKIVDTERPKVPCIHEVLIPEEHNVIRFTLQPAILRDTTVENCNLVGKLSAQNTRLTSSHDANVPFGMEVP